MRHRALIEREGMRRARAVLKRRRAALKESRAELSPHRAPSVRFLSSFMFPHSNLNVWLIDLYDKFISMGCDLVFP